MTPFSSGLEVMVIFAVPLSIVAVEMVGSAVSVAGSIPISSQLSQAARDDDACMQVTSEDLACAEA